MNAITRYRWEVAVAACFIAGALPSVAQSGNFGAVVPSQPGGFVMRGVGSSETVTPTVSQAAARPAPEARAPAPVQTARVAPARGPVTVVQQPSNRPPGNAVGTSPQRFPVSVGSRGQAIASRPIGDGRDGQRFEHRRRALLRSQLAYYDDPGIYSPPVSDYDYPYLYVQTFGYPFSALPFEPAEAPAVYPAPAQPQATPPDDEAQPDGLVQDVQKELSRRGYFAGKATGIVTKDFQTALRRFQTDQRLVNSGLINQATLYALGLN